MAVLEVISFVKYGVLNLLFEVDAWFRSASSHNKRYEMLKRYKNRYRGKRCFICATGPSLRMEDLEMLRGEYCFGVNSICEAYSLTKWRPTFYVFQDYPILEHYGNEIEDGNIKVFMGKPLVDSKRIRITKPNWIEFPLNCFYQMYWLKYRQKAKIKFSFDCYKEVYGGFTVTYSAIQLAVYMGFKEIYLLGVDCNYKPGTQNHFKKMRNEFRRTVDRSNGERELQIKAYKIAKTKADQRGCKIYNASRGGELNVFNRIELEEVLS